MYARHTLLDITPEGRRRLCADALAAGLDRTLCTEMFSSETTPENKTVVHGAIPGIVRREENTHGHGMIPVGFVWWKRGDSGRLRFPAFVRPDEVTTARDPARVLGDALRSGKGAFLRTSALRSLRSLSDDLAAFPLRLGVWGSAALELATGRQYTHAGSDLDVLLEPRIEARRTVFRRCLEVIFATERKFGLRIDAEVSLWNGYGVSLKELMTNGKTVLGKGRLNVRLFDKNNIFDELSNINRNRRETWNSKRECPARLRN